MILSPTFMGELLYDLEKLLFLKSSAKIRIGKSIYVCGLARAGTTVLMRALYQTDQFASLTYQDMPFVVAPNIWAKLSSRNRKAIAAAERAHGDGIWVDHKSPEAFEEVFWRVADYTGFVEENGIVSYEPHDASLEEYRKYQDLVCFRYQRHRYLSKNNNTMFRLRKLSREFADDVFLVPFRSPLAHSQSLLDQHVRFTNRSTFESDYMKWLGHFEFGDTQKHFLFDDRNKCSRSTEQLEYWLDVWIRTYSSVLDIVDSGAANLVLICYEQLCDNNPRYFAQIARKCDLPDFSAEFKASSKKPSFDVAPDLRNKAENLYNRLCEAGNQRLMAV